MRIPLKYSIRAVRVLVFTRPRPWLCENAFFGETSKIKFFNAASNQMGAA